VAEETKVLREVTMNDDLAKAVQAALNPEDLRAAVIAEAEKQSTAAVTAAAEAAAKAALDKAAADAAVAAAKTAEAAKGFTRTENIGGREFTFEAPTEVELERMINNALKVAYALRPTEEVHEVVPDAAAEAAAAAAAIKAAEAEAVAKIELEQKFKRGEISPLEYIKQSGALKDYLAENGVSIDALKSAVDTNERAQDIQSWEEAGRLFITTPAGHDWPGGDQNIAVIGDIIASRPELLDATDKLAAMATAYEIMKSRGTIFPYVDPAATTVAAVPTEAEKAAAAKATADKLAADAAKAVADKAAAELAAAAARRTAATSSSLFDRSSGIASTTVAVSASADAKVEIPANASPTEIMEAWKAAQLKQGKNPNDEFMAAFAAKAR